MNINIGPMLESLVKNDQYLLIKQILQDERVQKNKYNYETIFTLAIKFNNTNIMEQILQDPDFQPTDNYILYDAMYKGNPYIINLLLEDPRFDPGKDNSEALLIALMTKNYDLFFRLYNDPRVDPTAGYNRVLAYANGQDLKQIMKILLNDPLIWNSLDISTKSVYSKYR